MVANPAHRVVKPPGEVVYRSWRSSLLLVHTSWRLTLVFPSPTIPGRGLSDMTLTKLLRSTGLAEMATVHGFRTSFKTWCMEQTDAPWAVGEAAPAHTMGNSTEQAYARSDLFERRRVLMQQWADFATGEVLERANPQDENP